MQIYYPSLQAIEQRTMQLDTARCPHCGQSHQLVSHGFIRKKQVQAEQQVVGKRVLCSNRYHRTGCGRTMQLYLDTTVRYLHHTGNAVVAFVLSLMAGMSIQAAYHHATGTATARHAYRWLHRLAAQSSAYRSVPHRPPLQDAASDAVANRPARLGALMSTFTALLHALGQRPCSAYQLQLQRSFL
jgi:transposase-like protein